MYIYVVYISRLTVVSRVAKKNHPRDNYRESFTCSKSVKKMENKTNDKTKLPYCCHLAISLPLTTKTNFISISTGNPEIWFLRSLQKKFVRFLHLVYFFLQVVDKLMGTYV